MRKTRTARLLQSLALLTTLLAASGCDWLSPSGSATRSSPIIGELGVTPATVFCGLRNPLAISFSYIDPQDDYHRVLLTFEQTQPGPRIDSSASWLDGDLKTSPGRAIYDGFFFECGVDPAGVWTLTVKLEDERGHLSNELTAVVTLISSR